MTFRTDLKALHACADAVKWAGRQSAQTAWARCERGDWMHWALHRVAVPRNKLTLIACDHAERVAHLAGRHESACREAIATARGVVAGTRTMQQAAEAAGAAAGAAEWAAAEAAGAAAGAAAWAAAESAAWAAAWAAAGAAAEAAGAAAGAAGAAAEAAEWAAAWAAIAAEAAAAIAAERKAQADTIRKYISPQEFAALWKERERQ